MVATANGSGVAELRRDGGGVDVGVVQAGGAHRGQQPAAERLHASGGVAGWVGGVFESVRTAPASRLGWLGAHQRFTVGAGDGLIRMGVRLYNPALGRFLSVDPVEGGSANDYEYTAGDPVNKADLAGTFQYTLNFDLGSTNLSASEYMSNVAANFGDVLPIGRAPDRLPGVGTNVGLKVGPAPFPVYVSRRSANGWAFGTLPGHPDHKGWVSFKFIKIKGRMRLQVRAYVPDYSLGSCAIISLGCWAFRKRVYRGIASRTWSPFAENLRAQGW